MKILVDENIPRVTVERLREVGHDVRNLRGTPGQGLEDPDLWTAAMDQRRVLITTDRGFTEYRRTDHFGVRLRQPNGLKIQRAMLALERFRELLVVVRDATLSVSRRGGPIEKL